MITVLLNVAKIAYKIVKDQEELKNKKIEMQSQPIFKCVIIN